MTVPATTRRAGPFNGNGVTTAFPFTFKVFSDEDVRVVFTDENAVESDLVLDSDYSITLNGDQDASPGGSITYPLSGDPLAVGETLTAVGNEPYTQELDLPSGGNFSPRAIEDALDRKTFQIQQLAEELGRSLTLPVSAASADTQLPVPEANKVIGWNATADGLTNLDATTLVTAAAYANAKTEVFDGGLASYTLESDPGTVNNTLVIVGGVPQTPLVDYTVSGAVLVPTTVWPAGTDNVVVRYSPVVSQLSVGYASETQTVLAGATTITLATITYTAGVNAVMLFAGGAFLTAGQHYNEVTGGASLELVDGFVEDTQVTVVAGRLLNDAVAAEQVTTRRAGTYGVDRSQKNHNDDVLTSRQLGIGPTKSASYNRGALIEAMSSGLGKLQIVTDRAGEVILVDGVIDVPSQMEIEGYGRWGSVIRSTDLDAPIFRFANTSDNSALRRLNLSYQGTPVAGANAVEVNGAQWIDLHHLWISTAYTGIYIAGGGDHEIIGLRVYNYEAVGLHLNSAIDVNLTNFRMNADARDKGLLGGIRLENGVEAFTASQGDITLGHYGLTCDGTSAARGSSPWFNRFSQVYFDSVLENPAYLRKLAHTDFTDCWFASGGHDTDVGYGSALDKAGVDMQDCQHLSFMGGDAYNNGGPGVTHYAGNKFIRFGGGFRFKRNQFSRGSDGPAIEFVPNSVDFSVQGAIFERDADTSTYRQAIGPRVSAGTSDRYIIADNLLGGCVVTDNGSGSNKRVENNY